MKKLAIQMYGRFIFRMISLLTKGWSVYTDREGSGAFPIYCGREPVKEYAIYLTRSFDRELPLFVPIRLGMARGFGPKERYGAINNLIPTAGGFLIEN